MFQFLKKENRRDINIVTLNEIKSEEILKEEHTHINKLIQDNQIAGKKFLLVWVPLLIAGVAYSFNIVANFAVKLFFSQYELQNINQEQMSKDIHSLFDFVILLGVILLSITVFFFVLHVILHLKLSSDLKRQKETVIQLHSKISNQKAKKARWKKNDT